MKTVVLLLCCIAAAYAEKGVEAELCKQEVCLIQDDCRCASTKSPLDNPEDGPQLISLTFDEAVTDDLYNDYWVPLLFARVNPDTQSIGATFFVPHEYTDYQRVNDLYNYGFEIGVHSITKNPFQEYWRGASEEVLQNEFGGQKEVISKFANIPKDNIIGVRTPQLQLAENATIEAYVNSGLAYDSSWPTLPDHPLFPYTLNYLTTQQCNLGSKCPNEAFPGFWILPILDLQGKGKECDTLASCDISGSAQDISKWLVDEINKVRSTTRVPITLLVNSYWFNGTDNSWEGFNIALDTLGTYPDVFLVTQKQVLDWIRNPVPTTEFKTDNSVTFAGCNKYSCRLPKPDDTEDRYMNSCVPCPSAYPWLGNPDGNSL